MRVNWVNSNGNGSGSAAAAAAATAAAAELGGAEGREGVGEWQAVCE